MANHLREHNGLTHMQSDYVRDVLQRPHKHQHRKGVKTGARKSAPNADVEKQEGKPKAAGFPLNITNRHVCRGFAICDFFVFSETWGFFCEGEAGNGEKANSRERSTRFDLPLPERPQTKPTRALQGWTWLCTCTSSILKSFSSEDDSVQVMVKF